MNRFPRARSNWSRARAVAAFAAVAGALLAAPISDRVTAPLHAQQLREQREADARRRDEPSVPSRAAAQDGRQAGGVIARSGRSRSTESRPIASRPGTRTSVSRGPVQCEKCHADRQFLAGKAKGEKGDSILFVPDTLLRDSRHKTLRCADCHTEYNDGYPHTKVPSVSVSCQHCHEDQGAAYEASIHRPNFEKKGDAPTCVSCHSAHRVFGADDSRSPTYPLNVAQLCGSCHNKKAILDAYFDKPADSTARTAVTNFRRSAHGIAMSKAGLTVSATCSDCHDAHRVLPGDSTASTLNRRNVKSTCGSCHAGVLATYDSSAHGQALLKGDTTETGKTAPVCVECHGGHKVVEADDPAWFSGVVQECGACHKRLIETYFDTYHGKASTLGYGIAAKCSDCHTAHSMLPADDTLSSVHPRNRVDTCGACHKGVNANFVMYKPHGDPRDRENNPELYWVWLFMTILLVGVFSFFGLHSLLWFLRLMSVRKDRMAGHGGAGGHDSGGSGSGGLTVTPVAPPSPAPETPAAPKASDVSAMPASPESSAPPDAPTPPNAPEPQDAPPGPETGSTGGTT